jgi:hypothetical protein
MKTRWTWPRTKPEPKPGDRPEPIQARCVECGKTDFRDNMLKIPDKAYYGARGTAWSWGDVSWRVQDGLIRVVSREPICVHSSCSKVERCDCHYDWRKKPEKKPAKKRAKRTKKKGNR